MYRHPLLDSRINERRFTDEVKYMKKAANCGVSVPAIYHLDTGKKLLFIEYVDGITLKAYLEHEQNILMPRDEASTKIESYYGYDSKLVLEIKNGITLSELAKKIAQTISKLHKGGLIHGDMTSSNFMISKKSLNVVLIDFGLSSTSYSPEDRAVDLYVLEKSIISLQPSIKDFFSQILSEYQEEGMESVIDRLKTGMLIYVMRKSQLLLVKSRGRKKSSDV